MKIFVAIFSMASFIVTSLILANISFEIFLQGPKNSLLFLLSFYTLAMALTLWLMIRSLSYVIISNYKGEKDE